MQKPMHKMAKDGIFKSKRNGTGHILQDLLSSTVRLTRSNFGDLFPPQIEDNNLSPELSSFFCSICSESTSLSTITVQQMEILAKFVLNQEQVSLFEDHPPIFCCKICSSAILSLAKLSTQIENITISLRAVISRRNGLFNKVKNEGKISEFSNDIGGCPADHVSNNDDAQQLTGFVEEEEFFIKVEPTDDDEDDDDRHNTTSDPLYDPGRPEYDADSEDKCVCKICNVKFVTKRSLMRHLSNKKIHPEIPHADFYHISTRKVRKEWVCKLCKMNFNVFYYFDRHLRNKKIHPDISEAEILALESSYVKPNFVCQVCQPNVIFADNDDFVRHLRDKNIHPDFASAQVPSKFYDKECPDNSYY
ncbi:uncharacterized protein LOC110860353 isoform X1 [Folsomia candida]|uniref:uncharacterized protein LOC110860353 isoform X1 n=2 Tax=Folsomia candida TaxID=158441 RepID=UPI001604BE1E|nr:uncharacterized protein LOC110860353 isoform X1 [Folsomia candida]XP_035716114.1 uncharacterized protein LOC110860353 isoform X1 [Folsomia candida]XP_035716115.1 uncharacterized protein LOC110860353 isoform X1 [Folsomia candida]XP_035716116.1 uncharacterized protein LOC110860353 isoform X1 [Folsomia candida]XP_035716117.1 uncharacterized protein LOC110860353 isoform X1 [Folsomia candida]XP_035716118.1 uncharacterized protein LOC110860353 isoform X1 [Folsomia candida]XP_035716120.1 uncharac